jgi:chromosome segregation ATPase
MEQAKERVQEVNELGDASTKKCQKARESFEKVKNDRFERFNKFFEPISQCIDGVYKVGLIRYVPMAFVPIQHFWHNVHF